MVKPIKSIVKIQAQAGAATPAPPVGPALGAAGINIGTFIKEFNDATAEIAKKMGNVVVPAVITVYEDRTYSFITKTPPTSELIKKELKISKGSGVPNKNKVGKITQSQLKNIAEQKLEDLNTRSIDAAMKTVAGTAKNMGLDIVD